MMRILLSAFSAITMVVLSGILASAQQYKYETPIAPGVAVPDKLDTTSVTMATRTYTDTAIQICDLTAFRRCRRTP